MQTQSPSPGFSNPETQSCVQLKPGFDKFNYWLLLLQFLTLILKQEVNMMIL